MPQSNPSPNSASWPKILPLLAAVTAAASTLPALGATPVHSFHSSRTIGTTLDIQIATHDTLAAEAACTRIHNEISRLELMLSTRIPTSFISQINATSNPVAVPQEVLELLAAYNQASILTAGIISPLTGNLSARWSQAARENRLPESHELQTLITQIQSTTLTINPIASTVQRTGPATLNIDALGKPFILAKAADAGNHPSLTGLLLNIGGDILALGSPVRGCHGSAQFADPCVSASNVPWTIDITNPQNPADNAPPLATLNLAGATTPGATGLHSSQTRAADARMAVATSGDYARPRRIANQSYSHILNPLTGLPAAHAIAATVMHENPIVANALATAFCILGPDAAHLADKLGAEYLLCNAGIPPARSADISPVFLISEKLPLAANAATGSPTTQPATQPAGVWPKPYFASLALKIVSTGRPEREYVAVWVEDAAGKYVKTLALWGTDKYQRQGLTLWTKLGVRAAPSVTGATKNAGSYTVEWDGTDYDLKSVPQGKYTIRVESGSEHGGHYSSKTVLTAAEVKATATIPKSGAINTSTVTYAPKP